VPARRPEYRDEIGTPAKHVPDEGVPTVPATASVIIPAAVIPFDNAGTTIHLKEPLEEKVVTRVTCDPVIAVVVNGFVTTPGTGVVIEYVEINKP
jgi:hypothetical protein